MTSIPPTVRSTHPSNQTVTTVYAFDVALDPTASPPDGHFIPMLSGYAERTQAGAWEPVDPDHQPTKFQSLSVDGGATFELRLFSDSSPDTGSPEAVMVSSSPSVDSVAHGDPPPFPGPWAELTSNLWTNTTLTPEIGNRHSAGIGRTYEYEWVAGSQQLIAPTHRSPFLLAVRLCASYSGTVTYFAIDPELIIRGDG
ncbi:MAG: hypothetical protein MI919_41430 [Holophagales bacterium]|nr:hypothetical protein [Holophagales bacterium]